jgi:hypothetical protein
MIPSLRELTEIAVGSVLFAVVIYSAGVEDWAGYSSRAMPSAEVRDE